MRVQLAAAITLPSVVGGAVGQSRWRAKDVAASPFLASSPLWENLGSKRTEADNHVDSFEPDVGILSSLVAEHIYLSHNHEHLRHLDETNTNETAVTETDLCNVFSNFFNDTTVCDCSNWNFVTGNITCQLNQGQQVCSVPNNMEEPVCGSSRFILNNQAASNLSVSYCYDMTSPEEHVYCFSVELGFSELIRSGGATEFFGQGSSCTLTADGTDCDLCQLQQNCTGLGQFDCRNTISGTSGNQCQGDMPFPLAAISQGRMSAADGGVRGDNTYSSASLTTPSAWTAVIEYAASLLLATCL